MADKKKNIPLCRKCMVPLLTNAEAKVGIHIRCVFDIEQRQIKKRLPGPRYGRPKI